MDTLIVIAVCAFGLIVGSFLNVLVLRRGTGMSAAHGRSQCFSCGRTLAWYELIPLLSWVIQGGRCRSCRSRVSWQYPIVELAGGLAFLLAYWGAQSIQSVSGFAVFALTAALLSTYIAIAAYDIRHQIIPDAFSYTAALIALGLVALSWQATGYLDLTQVIAGPGLFLFFYIFWFMSRGTWMGLGDAKLALSVGWALGLSRGISALLLSFWIGAIVSLAAMAALWLVRRPAQGHGRRSLGLRTAIPFGPFLIIGFVIAYIWHLDVHTLSQAILTYLAV